MAVVFQSAGMSSLSYQAVAQEVSFNRDVRPILSDRCFHCHGPDAENQDSSFRLDTREHALEDLGGYAGIVPKDLENSELHNRIRSDDEDEQMPPSDSVRQLTASEKDILDAWIKQGANFDSHWSFQPIPKQIPLPNRQAKDWSRNAIDQFILATLFTKGVEPNREASREKWLRRVTFDLTGLPPTLAELDAFLANQSDQAFESVVDDLLARDTAAERLASEWLDVARYSDSFGYQRDDERMVWPYRDWVIGAFRDNMPYDQFVTRQLAGDLMQNPTRDEIVATTFNRLHSHKKEGGVALEEFRVENVADRTHTFAAAFMGLTMECARCHDHKYDPTKTKEYYQLSSFFANIDERGLISYFTDAVPTPAIPLPTPEQELELANLSLAVRAAEKDLAEIIENSDDAFANWLSELKTPDQTNGGDENGPADSKAIPGLVASLSFEQLSDVPKLKKGKYKNEVGKNKLVAEKLRQLTNAAAEAVQKTEANKAAAEGLGSETGVLQHPWTTDANQQVNGKHGKAIGLTGDDAIVLPGIGHYGRHQPFSISIWIKSAEVDDRAVIFRRSRGWDDAGSIGYELTKLGGRLSAKLVHFWPGNAICVETDQVLEADKWHHVVITYDGSSNAAGLLMHLDGKLAVTRVVQDSLTRNITQWREGYYDLAIGARYRDRGFKDGKVDEFRVFDRSLSTLEARQLYDRQSLDSLLKLAKSNKGLSLQQRAEVREYFESAILPAASEARSNLLTARKSWNVAMDATPAITIMREQTTPRTAYVLKRGAYDQHGEIVSADTPAFLPAFPENAPRDRLGLAQWVTSAEHPLTARVTVNRYWQMIFGTGLVKTPEDFGIQGELPTHPELLDWLSRDFISHGWDVRRLLKMMVLSSTYRQSAVVPQAVRDADPENRWLGRGPGQRLSAEMIRDNVLAVSGLLVQKVGGPPVKPYDVALAYNPLEVGKGDALYRRSTYTFWKRTSPAPVMMAMNAGKREVCRLRREVTDSPLQALVLLNGSQFIEASRVLGTELLKKHNGDIKKIAPEAFRLLTSRLPTEAEASVLCSLYKEQLQEFESDPKQAEELLKIGDAEVSEDISAAKIAAATVLVNSIMNLDESVRQR